MEGKEGGVLLLISKEGGWGKGKGGEGRERRGLQNGGKGEGGSGRGPQFEKNAPPRHQMTGYRPHFLTCNLRDPSADHRETLPHDRKLGQFYNAGPEIGGLSPKRIGGQKHPNFGRFYTTSHFDRE